MLTNSLKKLIVKLTDIKSNSLHESLKNNNLEGGHYSFMHMINSGKELFNHFYKVGYEAFKVHITTFKNITENNNEDEALIKNVIDQIVEIENWLYNFLMAYPDFCIQIDEHEFNEKDVCEVRSDIQFMLDLFMGTSERVDLTFKNPNDDDLIDDFDTKIKNARQCGEFTMSSLKIPTFIPKFHTWWFLN